MIRATRATSLTLALAAIACGAAPTDWRQDTTLPVRVTVRPVFFVPAGRAGPTSAQRARLNQHLALVRQRYVALLGGAGSFALDTSAADVVAGAHAGSYYAGRPEDGVPDMTGELLEHVQLSRFAVPWVFVIVVMNASADVPTGGGRPINGGFNNGAGVVVISSFALDSIAFIQSTLRHELGHAFGLVHVDAYGRDMSTDSSMMSYNPAHHTNGFSESPTPGVFSAEDRASLALNQRAFKGLTWSGPPIATLIGLPPMTIPGQPAWTGP